MDGIEPEVVELMNSLLCDATITTTGKDREALPAYNGATHFG